MSPSPRRAWIEITIDNSTIKQLISRPPHGGRGLKFPAFDFKIGDDRRPPHGGRGLKYFQSFDKTLNTWSPSPRRAWMEIIAIVIMSIVIVGRPPHGGRGLK